MIIIIICILYFKQNVTHTDDFTLNGYPASKYDLASASTVKQHTGLIM